MKDKEPTRHLSPPTLEQFKEFVKNIIAVPKSEIDKQEKRYRQERKKSK